MNYETWYETYKPIENELVPSQEEMFETFGEELEFVKNADQNKVWTLIDSDGVSAIVSGKFHVNRMGYYITEVAHDSEELIVVTISTEKECECYKEDGYTNKFGGVQDGNPDCLECEGYGQVTVYED